MIPALLTLSLMVQPVPAQAVFVDDAPAASAELARIERGQLPKEEAVRRLETLLADHARRLTPLDSSDEDLLIQVDAAVRRLLTRHPELHVRMPAPLTDGLMAARAAAANGATASAARFLREHATSTPLEKDLLLWAPPPAARDTFDVGDPLPDDLVERPLWSMVHPFPRATPLLAGDAVVLAGPGRIAAFDLLTGRPLWHRDNLADPTNLTGRLDGGLACAEAVHGGDIIAWMGRPTPTGFEGTGRVMRLDAATGAMHWSWDPEVLDSSTGQLRPSGKPLVTDAAVFLPLRRHGRAMEVESWIVALDIETGRPRWHRYLGTAAAPVRGVVWPGDAAAAVGDAVIVQTGTGVLASLDPRNGGIDWLRRMTPGRWTVRSNAAPPAWAVPVPFTFGPFLATLAPDRSAIVLLDPLTGEFRHTLPNGIAEVGDDTVVALGAGDRFMLTLGRSLQRWTLDDNDQPETIWTVGPLRPWAARPHLTDTTVLIPDGVDLQIIDLKDGSARGSLATLGDAHTTVMHGLLAASSRGMLKIMTGLDAALHAMEQRAETEADDAETRTAMTLLAINAERPDLVRAYLPRAMSSSARTQGPQAVDTLVQSMTVLSADRGDDMALVEAAVDVLRHERVPLPRVHLARGDWMEAVRPEAAVTAWLEAGTTPGVVRWVREGSVTAPVQALASRRLERHGLAHAVAWPPPVQGSGARLRAATLGGSPSRTDALAMISASTGAVDAISAARLGGLHPDECDALREAALPSVFSSGAVRQLRGAAFRTPIEEGLLLRDGARLTWHESPLIDASWTRMLDGSPAEVIAADERQLVVIVDRLGGGRSMTALDRTDGSDRWTLNLDQLGEELDPPIVLAASETIAALAGRAGVHLVDLRDGTALQHAPTGWAVDAVRAGDQIVLLLADSDGKRSTLHVVDSDGRTSRWRQPAPLAMAHWLARGPLDEIVLGNDTSLAFAPGPGERFWWLAETRSEHPLRHATVLEDVVIAQSTGGELHQVRTSDGLPMGVLERPPGAANAPLIHVMPTGDGLFVLRDTTLSRHGPDGTLLWADAAWDHGPAPLIIMAGTQTLLLQEQDILNDVLLATEARVKHRIKRLGPDGRLLDTLDVFPVASRIRRAYSTGGLLLFSDDLDTWLVPLPNAPMETGQRDPAG